MQDTKDRGQQAIIGTPEPVDPSPPSGGQIEFLPLTWRNVATVGGFSWVFMTLWYAMVHLILLPLSPDDAEPWSWYRGAAKAGVAAGMIVALRFWVLRPRHK